MATKPFAYWIYLLGLCISLALLPLTSPSQTSDLWGTDGESWSPQGRLPDFSFAGYHSGNDPIPNVPQVTNVADFGAVGDGTTDDSDAFLNAIAATDGGAIFVPPGRYRITKVLRISKGNLVLRGAGSAQTILYFPNSLKQTLGPAPEWAGNSGAWSWAGGWIWIEGNDTGSRITTITSPAKRGTKLLSLESTNGIQSGMTIRLVQSESDGSLGRHLHADYMAAGSAAPNRMVDFATQVIAVDGNQITIERPLRADVRLDWKPQIYSFSPTVAEVGVEALTIEFPNSTYPGHLIENGYNGIYLDSVSQCWIRDVSILDADSGILTAKSTNPGITRFCTFQGIHLGNKWRSSSSLTGHHGIALEGPNDVLVEHFQIAKVFEHDLAVLEASNGNVFSNGSGRNINFDHHRYVPYENLFAEIDVGTGDGLWLGSRGSESGSLDGGPPSAARETFWNIRTLTAMPLPDWPQMTVVGMLQYSTRKSDRLWVEQIDPSSVIPQNIYEAQLARRLSGQDDRTKPLPPKNLVVK